MSKIQAETLISVIGRHIASAELNLIKDFPWLEKDLADRSAVDRLNLKKLLAAGITVADCLLTGAGSLVYHRDHEHFIIIEVMTGYSNHNGRMPSFFLQEYSSRIVELFYIDGNDEIWQDAGMRCFRYCVVNDCTVVLEFKPQNVGWIAVSVWPGDYRKPGTFASRKKARHNANPLFLEAEPPVEESGKGKEHGTR